MTAPSATQTLHFGSSSRDFAQGYRVVAVEGSNVGKVFDSPGARCSIGTHESNHVRLEDRMVSRFHCELQLESQIAQVVDLDSKNGTFLDGVRIREAYLRHGSLLKLGQTVLRFEMGGESPSAQMSPRSEFGSVVGQSAIMRSLFDVLERVAPSDSTILLEGETGTGKGLLAESIHDASPRRGKPFEVVDCAAVPANLLESELFGHERGAFTGATSRRIGAFEAAHGGTIFLDEIGELPLDLQPKLLRALEERTIRRIGASSTLQVNVRIVAATNRDLRKEVNESRFRSDLYFRLAVINLRVPALRERPEDIQLLVERLLQNAHPTTGTLASALRGPEFIASLQRAPWPGNVRELRNHVERCLVLEQVVPYSGLMGQTPNAPLPSRPTPFEPTLRYQEARLRAQMLWEGEYLRALLEHHGGDVEAAACAAGISRAYIYRLLSRYGIRRQPTSPAGVNSE